MAVRIRKAEPVDADAVDRLWRGGAVPWAGTATVWDYAARLPSTLLVAEEDGAVVGYASVVAVPLWRERYAPIRLIVAEHRRRSGIGTALRAALQPAIDGSGVDRFFAQFDGADATSREFARRAGGRERGEHLVSVLDLATRPQPGVPPDGLVPVSPDLHDDRERDRVYAFLNARGAETPDARGRTLMHRDVFDAMVRDSWQVLLLNDGERDVAITSAGEEGDQAHTIFTGVVADARGRGLATWLKLAHAGVLRDRGATSLRTENMSGNEAILAVNRRLGFRRTGSYVDVVFEPDDPGEEPAVSSA